MNADLVILPDNYQRRSAIFIMGCAAVLALLFWAGGVAGSNAIATGCFLGMASLCGLLSFETRISQRKKRVMRAWSLAGFIPLWERAYRFDALRGVRHRLIPDAQHDLWQVGFVTDEGTFLMVTYFTSRNQKHPQAEAERFLDYLAGMLEVPVLDGDITRESVD